MNSMGYPDPIMGLSWRLCERDRWGRGGNKRGEEARGGNGDEKGKEEWVEMVELERTKLSRIGEHQCVKAPLERL
jgi:hypothetical protein